MVKRSTINTAAALAAVLLLSAACSESPSAPTLARTHGADASAVGDVLTPAALMADPELWHETVWVCKNGPTANMSVNIDGGAPTAWTIANGTCTAVWIATGTGTVDSVAVKELASTTYELDSINVKLTRFGTIRSDVTLTGTDWASVITTVPPLPERGKGGIITFYNTPVLPPPPPPPSGGQGCTPGYWKQTQHFDSWNGYSPNQLFSSVFEDAFPGKTLLQVLSQGGGGLNALGRHTVAALLNTANGGVNYAYTTAGVISAFNGVFPGGDYEGQKNLFAAQNELGCPLN